MKYWFSADYSGNMTLAVLGNTMSYTGTTQDGKLTLTCKHGTRTANIAMRLCRYSVDGGTVSTTAEMLDTWAGEYAVNEYFYDDNMSDCSRYELMTSPIGKYRFVIDGNLITPMEFYFVSAGRGNPATVNRNETFVNPKVNGANYFKYSGRLLMVVPDVNADNKVQGVKMFDITDGVPAAKEITLTGATISPVAYTYASAHGEVALVKNDNGDVVAADIELFLVVDGKVDKFTTAINEEVPTNDYGVYAYGLGMAQGEDESIYTLSFNLNGSSDDVKIVLVSTDGYGEIEYELGALEAGQHSYDIDKTEILGNYTWKVVVANNAIVKSDVYKTINSWGASASLYYRGGIAVECNPESVNFGTTYLSVGRSKGVFMYNPMYELKDGAPYWVGKFSTGNASSTYRAALYNDKFYLSDWSDAYPGVWVFDPANPTVVNNIFASATNDGTGKLSIGGVDVAGGTTGVAFTGTGASRKMFVYCEDLPSGNAGNKIYRYDIGAQDTWGAVAPVQLADASAKLINTNTGMLGSALHNVVFCSQTRDPGQNIASVPVFIVINEAGDIIFNGSDLVTTVTGCRGGGMALSADESKFAIVDASAAIQVYDVTWSGNVPSMTHVMSIPTNDQEINQMAFDYAGNLHCINRKHGYYVHAIPCEAREVETPASVKLVINGQTPVGIEDVTVDADEAPVYYNLQGVRVENPSNGIFIKKQGNKVTKVVK